LPPRLAIVLYSLFAVGLFFVENPLWYGVLIGLFVIVFFVARVRVAKKVWIPLLVLLLTTLFGNLFSGHGRVVFSAGPLLITEEGVSRAWVRTARFLCMVAGARLLTTYLSVESLVRMIGLVLKPLQRFGIPVRDFILQMEMTVQVLPILRDRFLRLYGERRHQEDLAGFGSRARLAAELLAPLFVQSVRSPETVLKDTGRDDHSAAGSR